MRIARLQVGVHQRDTGTRQLLERYRQVTGDDATSDAALRTVDRDHAAQARCLTLDESAPGGIASLHSRLAARRRNRYLYLSCRAQCGDEVIAAEWLDQIAACARHHRAIKVFRLRLHGH